MHKPWHSLAFVASTFISLGVLGYLFPKNGITIFNQQLSFFNTETILKKEPAKKDISKILNAANELDTSGVVNPNSTKDSDSTLLGDSTKAINLITTLQFKNRNVLKNFFNSLNELKSNPKAIRVLHYGDSQIECDRITDYLRLKLQGQFGGGGPGLVSLMPISISMTNKITNTGAWDRFGAFVSKDKRVKHSNYGVMIGFNRFMPYKELADTNSVISGNVSIVTTKNAGANNLNYKKVKLFYGGSKYKTYCEFYDGPALVGVDSLTEGGAFRIKEYNVGNGSYSHQFKFKGKDSPDFYGVSLESDNGILVDNISLRGSSGTFFHIVSNGQLTQFYDHLNVKLIILQFGGNVLPSIKNATMAANYAGFMRGQIAMAKKAAPNASFIFIGPADMSVKNGTEYETHQYLESVRDELKKAVIAADCAYFDMYDCMGGKNSMPSWVDQKLAASDYIHFSPQGARKIATLFYSALINEYNLYNKQKK